MRTIRVFFVGMCLVTLSGCWYHRPFLAHRRAYDGCCPAACSPAPCCPAPAPHCACYLGTPLPGGEPPLFAPPVGH